MSRKLNAEETNEILKLEPKDITRTFLYNTFANTEKSVAKYQPNDRFILPKGSKFENKDDIDTTIGRYVFNIYAIESKFKKILGYINEPITGGKYSDILNTLATSVLDEDITGEELVEFINDTAWLGYTPTDILTTSVNFDIMRPNPLVMKQKKDLLSKNSEAIKNNDVKVTTDIEKDLLGTAKVALEGNEGMQLFNSGAKGSFNNNYKNTLTLAIHSRNIMSKFS